MAKFSFPIVTPHVVFTEAYLPPVTVDSLHRYHAGETVHHLDSKPDINTRLSELLAIKYRMDADTKARDTETAKATAAKKAHDDLRNSPIALKALKLYNGEDFDYETWGDTNSGEGASDNLVRQWIDIAEKAEAKEKEASEKLAARREVLAQHFHTWSYKGLSDSLRAPIDRIIELEDAK